MSEFKPGDRVYLTDPGLAQLRAIMRSAGHESAPNHHGTVHEVWDDGVILIYFDDGQAAPYPAHEVRHLENATTDRRWTDADRELVARATFREAHDGGRFRWEDLQTHHREQAEAALAALAAAGRLADPQELERLRTERANLRQTLDATRQQLLAEANRLMRRPSHPPAAPDTAWWLRRLAECPVCSGPKRETTGMVCQACGRDWGPPAGGKPGFWLDDDGQWQPLSATPPAALSATESADQPHPGTTAPPDGQTDAEAGVGRALRARVAELEQQVAERSCRMCGGAHLVGGGLTLPCPACDVDGRPVPGWERQFCGTTGAQPDRWELPAPPGPEVTQVWDVENVRWTRQHPSVDRWVCDEHAVWESVRTWGDLLPRGPLSATPPETAGGGQA